MKRFDVFPIPPIFGHWVVEGSAPHDLAGMSAVTPHVYPLSATIDLLASSYTVTRPYGAAKACRHVITLTPLAHYKDLVAIAAPMGARPDDFVFVIELDDKTSLCAWVGTDGRAYVPGLVSAPSGEIVSVVQVWRRLPDPA